ncbi:hypothetical protein PG996_015700 [Apiospora saccharicola]|uniref:Mid2 domain-containing protein n=1 Tax=Apiospora saccharicola TaxID=335842 RepID=A0ABR1TLW6_9PEZI
MPGKQTASATTRWTTRINTSPSSDVTTLPSNTTTQYITTTTTTETVSTAVSTGGAQSPAATSTIPSTERDAGSAEDTVPAPAPSQVPMVHSANPAVTGGITGTFAGLAIMGIIIFIVLRRRKRRTVVDAECLRTRMYEIPAYEPKYTVRPPSK